MKSKTSELLADLVGWRYGSVLRSSHKPVLAHLLTAVIDCWVALFPAVPPPSLLGIPTAGIVSQGSIDYPQNLLLLLTIMGEKIVPLNYSE